MILIDSSIWIDHFRRPIPEIDTLIEHRDALTHPLVIGELSMGSLGGRRDTLRALARLPAVAQATHSEVMAFVEWQKLFGKGLGFIDAHLLVAARFTDGCRLWTHDQRLRAEADRLGLGHMA